MFNWWGSTETQENKENAPKEGDEDATAAKETQVGKERTTSEIDYAKDMAKNVGSKDLVVSTASVCCVITVCFPLLEMHL